MNVKPGSFCWAKPIYENELNQLVLIIATEETESFVLCCDSDVRLAGHLDVILSKEETGLRFSVTVLSHVARWVDNDRLDVPVGNVSTLALMEIENARAGHRPQLLNAGSLLFAPEIEPRWPMIEKRARRFHNATFSRSTVVVE